MPLMPRPGLDKAPPYIPGSHKLEGIETPAILSANENPLGPSPKAKEAYKQAAEGLFRYPDGGATAVREAIGKSFDLDPARIVCGAGSDELITLLTRMFVNPGDEVIYSAHGFMMYPIATMQACATPVPVPEQNLTADIDAMLSHVTDKTRLLFLANPNNPTGSCLPESELRRLAENLPDHVLLVIDSAYAEYVQWDDYTAGAAIVDDHANVAMLRTFSKAFGLAAVRLGWCYAQPEVIELMHRVRNPFNVNVPAQMAGIAALGDMAHIEKARSHNAQWLSVMTQKLRGLGYEVADSYGNFLLVNFGDAETATRANQFMMKRGVIARPMAGAKLPSYIRISVGLEWENTRCLDVLGEFKG